MSHNLRDFLLSTIYLGSYSVLLGMIMITEYLTELKVKKIIIIIR